MQSKLIELELSCYENIRQAELDAIRASAESLPHYSLIGQMIEKLYLIRFARKLRQSLKNTKSDEKQPA